jgi:hypothetical protein
MDGEEDRQTGARIRTWLIGAMALAAWFAMLWFMFGDVM